MRTAERGIILPTTMVVLICMFLLGMAIMGRGTGGMSFAKLAADDEIKMNNLSRMARIEAQYRIDHDIGFIYSSGLPGHGPDGPQGRQPHGATD